MSLDAVHASHPAAKEKRQCYTLGPVPNTTDVPTQIPSTPAAPSYSQKPSDVLASRPPPATGPDRSQRVTRQARLRTGHLPPRPKEQASMNRASVTPPQATVAAVNVPTESPPVTTPIVEIPPVITPIIEIPPVIVPQSEMLQSQVGVSAVDPYGLAESNTTSTPNHPSDATSVPDDCASDGGSYTSTLPDVFDVGMDDSEPPAAGPWRAIDHLTSEIIVDDGDPIRAVPTDTRTGIEIGILPRLGVHILTKTEPPTLLFEDEDVRPEWLISAVKEFLRYTPYYGRLGKVIDLFLTQEARLGYPNLVMDLYFSLKYSHANTTLSLCAGLFPPAIGPLRWGNSRSGPESFLVVMTWVPRGSVQPSSSGGSPSNQPPGNNGHQPMIHFRVISHLITSIVVDPMVCFW